MRAPVLFLLLILGACMASPGPDAISTRLIGAKVIYDLPEGIDGPPDSQTWAADGTTVYNGAPGLFGGRRQGRWDMRAGRYCSDFSARPRPKEEWTCWRVALSDAGRRIRFSEIRRGLIVFFQREYSGRFVN